MTLASLLSIVQDVAVNGVFTFFPFWKHPLAISELRTWFSQAHQALTLVTFWDSFVPCRFALSNVRSANGVLFVYGEMLAIPA